VRVKGRSTLPSECCVLDAAATAVGLGASHTRNINDLHIWRNVVFPLKVHIRSLFICQYFVHEHRNPLQMSIQPCIPIWPTAVAAAAAAADFQRHLLTDIAGFCCCASTR